MTARRDTASKAEQGPASARPESKNFEPHECLIHTVVQNSATMLHWGKQFGVVDVNALTRLMNDAVNDAVNGNTRSFEVMLVGQAMALQTIFSELSARASRADNMGLLESYMRLALKAQTQCRATLEALATIKSPPILFARQANFANGPQQVNNVVAPDTATPATKTESSQTELLEANHGERLDIRAAGTTSGADPRVEAVGERIDARPTGCLASHRLNAEKAG